MPPPQYNYWDPCRPYHHHHHHRPGLEIDIVPGFNRPYYSPFAVAPPRTEVVVIEQGINVPAVTYIPPGQQGGGGYYNNGVYYGNNYYNNPPYPRW